MKSESNTQSESRSDASSVYSYSQITKSSSSSAAAAAASPEPPVRASHMQSDRATSPLSDQYSEDFDEPSVTTGTSKKRLSVSVSDTRKAKNSPDV